MAANGKTDPEAEIRALMDGRVKAVRAKDLDRLLSHHTPDVRSFDVVNPLQYVGSETVRERAKAWFSSFQGPFGFEIRDLGIAAGDDVAFCHSLNQVRGTTTDGRKIDMWWRATVCCRRIDGKWMIIHEHNSVPFDPASGKASLDLKP